MTRTSIRWLARAVGLAFAAAACTAPGRYDPVSMDPEAGDAAFPASMTGVRVPSGASQLNGIVYRAQGAGPHPVVILLHGYPGDERNLDLAQAVRRAGWNVLFFHYRGAWGSEGAFSFTHALEDVTAGVRRVQSADFAREHRIDPARIALVGHSMGGFLALVAGSELAAVDCVASLAGANLGILGMGIQREPARAEAAERALGNWSGPIRGPSGRELVAEIAANAERFELTRRAPRLATKTLLLVGAERDAVTPPDLHHEPLRQALQEAGAERLTTAVMSTDHAFSDRRVALARQLVSWLGNSCR